MFQVREHAGLARGPLSSVGAALFAPRNTRPRTARATAPRSTVRLHALACVLRWSPALPLYSRVVVNLHLCSAAAPPSERVDLERGVGAQAHRARSKSCEWTEAGQGHPRYIENLFGILTAWPEASAGVPRGCPGTCGFSAQTAAPALARGHFASPACSRAGTNKQHPHPLAGRQLQTAQQRAQGVQGGVCSSSHTLRGTLFGARRNKQAESLRLTRLCRGHPRTDVRPLDAPGRPLRPADAPNAAPQRGGKYSIFSIQGCCLFAYTIGLMANHR